MHLRFTLPHWLSSMVLVQALVGIPAALGEEKLTSSTASDNVDEAQADEVIRRALGRKVSVDFNAVPLSQVVAKVSADYGVNAIIDKKALDDAGLDDSVRITLKVTGASLRSTLRQMLKDYDLTWIVRDGLLVITTVDEAGSHLTTKVHDVSDLLKPRIPGLEMVTIPLESLEKPLLETIRAIVFPTTWDEVGGPGTVKAFNGMLVISQTDEAHEAIEKLLAELRKVQAKRDANAKPQAEPARKEPVDPQALQLRIYRVGERVREGWFGCLSVIPVVGNAEPATEPSAASAPPKAAPAATPPSPARYDVAKELSDAIPAVIEPKSWESGGGQGTIRVLHVGGFSDHGTLLVRQTPAVHGRIVQLLLHLDAGGGLGRIQAGEVQSNVSGGGFF